MITLTAYVANDSVDYQFNEVGKSFTALVFLLSNMEIDFEVNFSKGEEDEDS